VSVPSFLESVGVVIWGDSSETFSGVGSVGIIGEKAVLWASDDGIAIVVLVKLSFAVDESLLKMKKKNHLKLRILFTKTMVHA